MTRPQLLEAGLTARQVERWITTGRLHPKHRGVYAVGRPDLPPLGEEQAALLAVGANAALSHRSAAVVWELLPPRPGPVDILHWPPHRRPRPGIRLHRATTAPPTRTHQGLPVTTPADTLAALTRAVTAQELDHAHGTAEAKRLMPRRTDGFTRSKAERLLLRLVDQARLPRPRTNVPLHGYEVDALWPEQRLVVEIDGFAFHNSREAFERDRARDADLQLHGYTVLRFTWRRLVDAPHAVVAVIAAALARA